MLVGDVSADDREATVAEIRRTSGEAVFTRVTVFEAVDVEAMAAAVKRSMDGRLTPARSHDASGAPSGDSRHLILGRASFQRSPDVTLGVRAGMRELPAEQRAHGRIADRLPGGVFCWGVGAMFGRET